MYGMSMKPYKCIVFGSMDPQSLGGTPFRMKCTYHTNLCDTYNDNVGVLPCYLQRIDDMHAGRESREQPKVSHFLGQLRELCIDESVKMVRTDKGVVKSLS